MNTNTTDGKGSDLTKRHLRTLSEKNFRKASKLFDLLYCNSMGIPEEGKTEPVKMTSAQISSAKLFLEKIMPNLKNIDIDELISDKKPKNQYTAMEVIDAFNKMFVENSRFVFDMANKYPETRKVLYDVIKDIEFMEKNTSSESS